MSGRAGAVQFLILLAAGLLIAHGAGAQFNPLSVVGSAVSTALDARSKADAAAAEEMAASAEQLGAQAATLREIVARFKV